MIREGEHLDLGNFHGSLRHGIDSAPQPFAISLLPSLLCVPLAVPRACSLSHRPIYDLLTMRSRRPSMCPVPVLDLSHLEEKSAALSKKNFMNDFQITALAVTMRRSLRNIIVY